MSIALSNSIASPPEERRWLELFVRHVVAPVPGLLTTRLFELEPGARVLWTEPHGSFVVGDHLAPGRPDRRRLLLVGGGTGVAPFVSTVRHLDAVGTEREVVVCHGARHVAELAYAELLQGLARRSREGASGLRRLDYLPTVSRPDAPENAGWRGHVGRVETLLPRAVETATGEALSPASTCVHVCGFQGTVDAALAVLEPLGFRTRRRARPDGSFDVLSESYG